MNIFQKSIKAIVILSLLIVSSCQKDSVSKALKIGTAPGEIKKYSFEAIPGGAIITYELPEGTDLRYVKATYTLNSGVTREAKSTIYKNTIQVDGFAKEGEYDITLVAVGLGDVASGPMVIKVNVLRPSHQLVMDSVKINKSMYAAFGGLNIDYSNISSTNLIFHILSRDQQGNWAEIQTVYSAAKKGRVRTRGLEPVLQDFAAFVTDRWNNRSDTVTASLTPFKEALITTRFTALNLPGDTWEHHTGQGRARPLAILFDGLHPVNGTQFQTKPSSVLPQWFTWDMTAPFRLSRFILYPDYTGNDKAVFGGGQPLEFELWGSNHPLPDFSNWTKVGVFKSVKPSGNPLGINTIEDVEQAKNGEEFEIEGDLGSFRYWRFKTISTWGAVPYIQLSELTFYGAE